MIYTRRFEWHRGLFFNYRIKWYAGPNPNDNNRYWQYEDVWFVGIQLNKKWFEIDSDLYYDGHTAKAITILGVRFIKGYSWQAEPIV